MEAIAITQAVVKAYESRYPEWTNHNVIDVVPAVGSGHLAVVQSLDENRKFNEELCYVSPQLQVRIFDGSTELAHYVGGSDRWYTRMFSASIVSGLAFLITLLAVVASAFYPVQQGKASDALYSLLALAAGFYFGSQSGRR